MSGFNVSITGSVSRQRADASYYPTESWWVGLDRDGFTKRARLEWMRMRMSRYGRLETLATGPEEPPRRRTERAPL